ncbi:sulfite exporter TauE/SafE family protein [archaeon]|jgi:uncharacterized protein|nr:sulfite exporter TauE/SafE family protein [archaeon]MBT4416570.1 sulfite exporter TauE/SafE family protein [archaeon]
METKSFRISGMVCHSCEKVIINEAKDFKGVKDFKVDYKTQKATVTFDPKQTSLNKIFSQIEENGYSCSTKGKKNWLGWAFGTIGVIILFYFILQLSNTFELPQISSGMGYGLLFVVGLLTGLHCVSMCGGFVLSYTAKDAQEGRKSYLSHFRYGLGKTISYTLIGAMFGLLGSIIAFTPTMRGIAGLLAGLFLILFGLKMLNIVPALSKIQFTTPKFISQFVGKNSKNSSPLVIGLLNGLMIACGPLQAIYIMAAGTGSMIEGAKLLFIFALGTLPVMLGFGFFSTFVSSKLTNKLIRASGIIVIVLGLFMINNGLALTGTGYDFNTLTTSVSANFLAGNANSENLPSIVNGYQEIRMDVDGGFIPNQFILQEDIPVKWIIDGIGITGCNNAIQVPEYDLYFDIVPGEQTIEFTPTETGTVSWSCWMGMIPGTFIVVEDLGTTEVEATLNSAPAPTGGGCGGGCGCGG